MQPPSLAAPPPSPPLPSLSTAIQVTAEQLPAYLDSLALAASYSLTNGGVAALVRTALYSFVFHPHYSSLLLPPDLDPSEAQPSAEAEDDESDWSLLALQSTRTGAEYSSSRRGKVCGHVFTPGESVYRCRSCSLDATCVLCSKCYQGSVHQREGREKHDVTMSVHAGVGAGCCDCGDWEAWREGVGSGGCRWHDLATGPNAQEQQAQGAEEEEKLLRVEELKAELRDRLRILLDWSIAVLRRSPETIEAPRSVEDILAATMGPPVAGSRTEDSAAMETDDDLHSQAQGSSSWSTTQHQFTDAEMLPHPSNSSSTQADPFALPPPSYASTSRAHGKSRAPSPPQSPSSEQPPPPASPQASQSQQGPWSLHLWNDERHSFAQVISILSSPSPLPLPTSPSSPTAQPPLTPSQARRTAERVDHIGRATILTSSSPELLLRTARRVSAIELGVSVRGAQEGWREDLVGEVVRLVGEVGRMSVGGEGGVGAEATAEVLLEEYRGDGERSTRFEELLKADARLWKEPRKGLAEAFVTLLGVSAEVKMSLSLQFAHLYPTVLAPSYLLYDREPEHSIIFLGVQVFTVPSVSRRLLAEHQWLERVVGTLFGFFTEQLEDTDDNLAAGGHQRKRLRTAPDWGKRTIDPESQAFKQKRYFQIFSDLAHLISSNAAQDVLCAQSLPPSDAIASSTRTPMALLTAFLSLFTGMNPASRAIVHHVEYESDLWVICFNVTIQLGKLCRGFGEAFGRATAGQLAYAVGELMEAMAKGEEESEGWHEVSFGRESHRVVSFDVGTEPVSFHHPLGWLMGEMMKHVQLLDGGRLSRELGIEGGLRELLLGRDGDEAGRDRFLRAMDHPLRVIVLVAQVRVGLWVRNGFAMRAQQLHYKEYSLRENTYDQDIVFLQAAFVVLPPPLVFVAILDRFAVLEWIAYETRLEHGVFEQTQAMAMTEELLYLIIILLSDPTYAGGLTNDQVLRREIVHNLALGPSAYSDLMRRVSEKFADDPSLDRILAEVSTYKPPGGTSDQGTYTLRPECFETVNPYFPRYSRNQREEAEKIVREQLKKQRGLGEKEAAPTIVPQPLGVTSGPFVSLVNAYQSDELYRIIYYSMRTGRGKGPTMFSEVLVDEALHLSMLALVESPQTFSSFAASPSPTESSVVRVNELAPEEGSAPSPETFLHLLVQIEEDERMKALHHKARWCLDRLTEIIGPQVSSLRKVEDSAPAAKALDAKRLAAKARQEAIMKQFAAAQQSFLDSVEDEDGDEDEETFMVEEEGVGQAETKPSLGSCIVCQDDLDASRAFGALTFVQTSNMIRLTPDGDNANFQEEVLHTPASLDQDASHLRPFGIASQKIPVSAEDDSGDGLAKGFPQYTETGLYASACGHMMHLACFDTYYKSIEQRHHLQPTRNHPENTARCEFICPLCKSLGNVLLPATVESEAFDAAIDEHSLEEWASLAYDPTASALARGAPLVAVAEIAQKIRGLQARSATRIGLKPWRISLTLPSTVPAEFAGGEPLMTARLLVVLDPLMQEIHGGAATTFIPHDLLAYTISSLEIASRGQGEPADAISDATLRMLKSFLLVLANLVHAQLGVESSSELAAMAVLAHLGGSFSTDKSNSDFFNLDPLSTLIEGAAVMPSAFYHMVSFAFYTELVKNFLAIGGLLRSSSTVVGHQADPTDKSTAELTSLASIRHFFVASSAHGLYGEEGEATLGKLLYSYMLPFLRRAAIVHRTIFGHTSVNFDEEGNTEFTRLLSFLRIPSPSTVLQQGVEEPSQSTRAIHSHIAALRDSIPGWRQNLANPPPGSIDSVTFLPHSIPESILASAPPIQHPAIYELVGLPQQLDTLAAESLQRKCGRCEKVPSDPALCLFCGQIVCCQSFCCMDDDDEAQNGECNTHMWSCGGSVGVYFIIKRNSILYLYTDKGTFSTPPYLDSHGEVDIGGRRSRSQFPQFLHQGRYDEIRKAWLSHGIPTFVARKLDSLTDHGGWTSL